MEAWHAPRITRPEKPPHIVTFSSGTASIETQLRDNKDSITEYIHRDYPTTFLAIGKKQVKEISPPLQCIIPKGHVAYSCPMPPK